MVNLYFSDPLTILGVELPASGVGVFPKRDNSGL